MSCYVHDVPGRLRVRMPETKGNAIIASKLVNRLNALEGITSVKANAVTGSILIRYDARIVNAAACLAILNIQARRQPARRLNPLASKVAEAATWYVLEKAFERCLPMIFAAVL